MKSEVLLIIRTQLDVAPFQLWFIAQSLFDVFWMSTNSQRCVWMFLFLCSSSQCKVNLGHLFFAMNFCPFPHSLRDQVWLAVGIGILAQGLAVGVMLSKHILMQVGYSVAMISNCCSYHPCGEDSLVVQYVSNGLKPPSRI